MARTEDDTWDLASSVGTTATMVAAARAVGSRQDDPLFNDPFAAPLVRAVGIDFFTRLVDGEIELPDDGDPAGAAFITTSIAVRTRFFDDFFVDAGAVGIRQSVILASGLDSRAYRLPWPDGTVVYEIDQPQVIDFKTTTMASIGASLPRRGTPHGRDRPARGLAQGVARERVRRFGAHGVECGGAAGLSAAGGAGSPFRRHRRAERPG